MGITRYDVEVLRCLPIEIVLNELKLTSYEYAKTRSDKKAEEYATYLKDLEGEIIKRTSK